jgi:hypothetical protein
MAFLRNRLLGAGQQLGAAFVIIRCLGDHARQAVMGTVNMTLRATDATLKAGSMTRDAADNLKHFSSRCAPRVLLFPLEPARVDPSP